MPIPERLEGRIERGEGCWEWRGYRSLDGYGYARPAGGTPIGAHRIVYECLVGPVPDGLHLDHLCRNRGCVNPSHLEPVTPGENARRGIIATRPRCGAGHLYTPETTYMHPNGDRRCRICKKRRDAEYRDKRKGDEG